MKYSDDEKQSLQKALDGISELIYIADCETYELLYVNKSGMEQFGIDEIKEGTKCYKVFQKFDAPCSFCTNKFLKEDQDYIWDIQNPVTGRYYRLKDRLLQWKGRMARMEIAFDLTEVKQEQEALQYAFDTEKMILECVRILNDRSEFPDNINAMLRMMGEYLNADRMYIFENKNGMFYNTFEWCRENAMSQIERMQTLDMSVIQSWEGEFRKHRCVVIEDVEKVQDSTLRKWLCSQGIRSLVTAPLEYKGELIGCFGVDNPPLDKRRSIISLLETLRYFITMTIQKRADEQLLEQLSLYDTLTGLYNRNKYILDVDKFSKETGFFGIFYLDVNGLKEINDEFGHAYGDSVLKKCTERIRQVFEKACIYRTGGDEFIVIIKLDKQDAMNSFREALVKSFSEDEFCSVAIGCRWAEDPSRLNRYIEEADNLMYEDKRRHYEAANLQDVHRYRCVRDFHADTR